MATQGKAVRSHQKSLRMMGQTWYMAMHLTLTPRFTWILHSFSLLLDHLPRKISQLPRSLWIKRNRSRPRLMNWTNCYIKPCRAASGSGGYGWPNKRLQASSRSIGTRRMCIWGTLINHRLTGINHSMRLPLSKSKLISFQDRRTPEVVINPDNEPLRKEALEYLRQF